MPNSVPECSFDVRTSLVEMLTTHRHGEDKKACGYCAEFYGGIVDKVLAHLGIDA